VPQARHGVARRGPRRTAPGVLRGRDATPALGRVPKEGARGCRGTDGLRRGGAEGARVRRAGARKPGSGDGVHSGVGEGWTVAASTNSGSRRCLIPRVSKPSSRRNRGDFGNTRSTETLALSGWEPSLHTGKWCAFDIL